MKVYRGLDAVNPLPHRPVLTVGNFDGVHRAHQHVLARASSLASKTGGLVVVMTFEPHPLSIIAPDNAPAKLSTTDDKLAYLEAAGAEIVVVARSDPALLAMEAEQFVEKVIVKIFAPTHIVEGPSFGFGRGRKGTPELLAELASQYGYEMLIADPVTIVIDSDDPNNTQMISSSLVRRLVVAGDVAGAARCLGRDYSICGKIIEGERRGKALGFPTANLSEIETLLPADGVYSGYAITSGARTSAAISIGVNATFGGNSRSVEAHLLDFDGDLYGKTIRLEFAKRLRDHQRFDSAEALVDQLHRDVATIRECLSADCTTNGGASV